MRMLVQVKIPHKEFNTAVKDGSAGKKIRDILEHTNPESVYFTEFDGLRGAIMLVDVADASKVPGIAEPWFLSFNANVEFHIVMSPEELGQSGLDDLGKKWG